MFKPKQKNRRRKRSSFERQRLPNSTSDDQFVLNAEIGSLEDLLADLETPHVSSRDHLSRQDILPPPEPRIAHHHPRAVHPNRSSSGTKGLIQFIILLAIALALIFWLFYTGG